MSKITVDGNTATARVAYAFSEVATIYPITPSSTMAELADSMSNDGIKNLYGNTLKVVEMQSEGGAAGALHGALSAGALTTTFTASQGLLLMIPNMYKIAGELLPCVMHVSARTLATHALSIFGDHSDVMACRQTGFAFLASGSVQEAQDMALASHLATLKSSVPFVHFFDGFRTSHEINTIEDLDYQKVKQHIPFDKIAEFKKRALNSSHPHQQGTAQNPDIFFQNREACNSYYNEIPNIMKNVFNEVKEITGRSYGLFDYVGCKNPEYVTILMGSGTSTAETTINYLNKTRGTKYGIIKVRLFRPFSAAALSKALPKSVKAVCVLDRTKEPGSVGEPLYLDVLSALNETNRTNIKVIGGRYGLGSKEFTPSMVNAVFQNLVMTKAKNHFTVGINDDVTNLSISVKEIIHPSTNSITSCKFYGYGGDGTVSANKSSIKIIGNNTKLNGQAYFEYDSKKSGNATISHLRFGKDKINESYLLDNIDFVSVHNQTYVKKYNILKGIKTGGTLLLNTNWNEKELETLMPASLKREIANKKIKFYIVDAYSIAQNLGLNTKINLIMQSAFFKLINIIPFAVAKKEMKEMAYKNYGSKGEKVLQSNYKAIESAEDSLQQIKYPETWKNEKDSTCTGTCATCSKYYEEFVKPIEKLDGDSLAVSAFNPNGSVPTGTSQYEKRGIATSLPCWNSENCIQCNMCAFVCPHAAIRPILVEEKELKNKPDNLPALNATAESGKKFILQLDPMDCTGCGVCASVCPTKNKALTMVNAEDILEKESANYNYVAKLKGVPSSVFKPNTVKGIGFNKPYFEFSGACAGCGETPYLKVVSQLFGDHMIIANATGCSSIYGGSSPTCPYTFDDKGGPAWANSLFEDNAEFGLGIKFGVDIKQNKLKENLNNLLNSNCASTLKELITNYLSANKTDEQRELGLKIIAKLNTLKVDETIKQNILNLSDSFVNQSVWIVGGDGWAYDIGYGGLDHVLASGQNVNILVLDTEVYSNTGGQASKATPTGAVAKFASGGKNTAKKDLGLIATCYKDVYVAKVSMGADMNQFIKAVTEAEAYDGVSLIIAYAPCINHGINMNESQLEMKKAVECGYWTLWRYNPNLIKENKNPFVLDSKEPSKDYLEFLNGESRYFSLMKKDPERAKVLFEKAKEIAENNFKEIKKLSEEN